MEIDTSEFEKPNPPRQMIFVAEAAQIMGVSADKVYQIIRDDKDGKFPYVKIGAKILIPKNRLYDYLGLTFDPDEKQTNSTKLDKYMTDERKMKLKKLLHQLVDVIFE